MASSVLRIAEPGFVASTASNVHGAGRGDARGGDVVVVPCAQTEACVGGEGSECGTGTPHGAHARTDRRAHMHTQENPARTPELRWWFPLLFPVSPTLSISMAFFWIRCSFGRESL